MKYITKFTEVEKDKTANMPELFVGINSNRELIFLDINDKGNYFSISGDSVIAVKEDTAEEQTKERIRDFYEHETPSDLSYVLTDDADDTLREMIKEHYTFYAEDIAHESSDEYTNRLAEEMEEVGVISEEEAKDEEYDLDNDIDDFAQYLTDNAGDPYEYFVDNFGEEEANKIVMNNGLLDLDKVAEQENWEDWFDNSTLTDEVDYKGETYLFEALGGGQNRDELDDLVVSFVPEKILEQIKSNWDKYHLKVLPKKDYFPEIEQDKGEILEWYLEHGITGEYAKGGMIPYDEYADSLSDYGELDGKRVYNQHTERYGYINEDEIRNEGKKSGMGFMVWVSPDRDTDRGSNWDIDDTFIIEEEDYAKGGKVGGRGWSNFKKGKRVRDVKDLKVGEMYLNHSPQFNANNIVLITSGDRTPLKRDIVYGTWVNPLNLEPYPDGDEFAIWGFQLDDNKVLYTIKGRSYAKGGLTPKVNKHGYHVEPFFKAGEKVLYLRKPAIITRVNKYNPSIKGYTYNISRIGGSGVNYVASKANEIRKMAKGGKVLSEDELWDIIESYNWKKDGDYNRIGKDIKKLSTNEYKQLRGFAEAKHQQLTDKYHKEWMSDSFPYTGDDSWGDLRAEIVGRGKKFYNNINKKKLREMAETQDYNENFLYIFQKHKDWGNYGGSDDLINNYEKWFAKGGEIEGMRDYIYDLAQTTDAEGLEQIAMALDIGVSDDYDPEDETEVDLLFDKILEDIEDASDGDIEFAYDELQEQMYAKGGLIASESQWKEYRAVQDGGYYNMMDPRAREMTSMSKGEYVDILKNYTEYEKKYGRDSDYDVEEEIVEVRRPILKKKYAKGGEITQTEIDSLARKLLDESDYYYELEQEGYYSSEVIFEKAQEEAEEMLERGEGYAKGGKVKRDIYGRDEEEAREDIYNEVIQNEGPDLQEEGLTDDEMQDELTKLVDKELKELGFAIQG